MLKCDFKNKNFCYLTAETTIFFSIYLQSDYHYSLKILINAAKLLQISYFKSVTTAS